MKFPHTYFEDEIREGFYISGIMKRIWAAQLEVLEVIDNVCKKHDIRWFADCGTLLGAVRHGGYIPWDDDLDICMLRDEYIRFNKIVKRELPEGYFVLNLNNDEEPYYEHLTRVTNGHRINFDKEYLDKYHECPYAIGIDIFPLDYIAEDEEEEQQRKDLATLVMTTADEINEEGDNVDDYKDVLKEIEEFCDVKFNYKKNIKQQLFQTTEKIFSLYSRKKGKHVALMPYWVYFDNHKYPVEYFEKTIMMPFETTEIPVPAAYDGVLRIEYGDYMKINRAGGVHGYPFYTEQEQYLIDLIPEYHFKYKFSKEHLKNPVRDAYQSPKKQAENFVGLMNQAHGAIIKTIEAGQYDTTNQLLLSCQNSAVQIGTLLEDKYGIGFATVGFLEQYCEVIYQVFEMVQEVSQDESKHIDVADLEGFLQEILGAIAYSIEHDIPKKKEILFISTKASAWDAFDSVWRAAKEDGSCDVYVMPVPYYERNSVGGKKDTHFEKDLFPDYLEVIDYESYDIEKHHPDVIFIQNPYDECNYTTNILPRFFSANIKGFTDKLVYIPWFKLAEFGEGEEKPRKTMDYFCTVPGIVHADVVIVQSEQMRKEYIQRMTEFAGEDTRSIWEEKIIGLGTPIDDAEQKKLLSFDKKSDIEKLPEAWKKVILKDNGDIKKIILYNTTVAAFMQSGEKLLAKIEKSLATFKKNKDDIALIWRPHPLTMASLKASKPELLNPYVELVEKYCLEQWGIYDDTPSMEMAVALCDAYYGDADGIAHKCETLGKPVMYQNPEI